MKNLIISGATKGIGRAIVHEFAANHWNIVFCSRKQENINALSKELSQYKKITYRGFVCNVSVENELTHFAQEALSHLGKVDVLINNAGVFEQGNLYDMPINTFDKQLKTNLYSAFILSQKISTQFIKQKHGLIINISSIAGIEAYPNGGAYNVSKFALTGFSKTLRQELKEFNIGVSTIYPGATLTDSWSGTTIPPNRFMPPEDIAKICLSLSNLSPRSVVEDIVLRPMRGDL